VEDVRKRADRSTVEVTLPLPVGAAPVIEEEEAPAPPRYRHKWYRPAAPEVAVILGVTVLAYVAAIAGLDPHHADVYRYVARVSGLITYGFLTMAVALGTFLATRWRAFQGPWLVAERLHPLFLLLAIAFLSFHLAALLFNHFSWLVAFVPFVPSSRVIKAALGIISMYLMIVLSLSTYLIGFIGFRTWRVLHHAGFISWIVATFHGIAAGSDTGAPGVRAFYAGSTLLVIVLAAIYATGHLREIRPAAPSTTG
jgi:predicted ferric reductase